MNSRTIILILAVGLLGIGLVLTLAEFFSEPPVEQRVSTAVARVPIDPYTVITRDMVGVGEDIRARDARDQAVYPIESVYGKMSTASIAPGDVFTAGNSRDIEDVRFVKDLNLEIVSFAAGLDELVGGQIRPGHVINLYGTGRNDDNQEFTVMIEPRLWVVGVQAGGGPVSEATPLVNPETGAVEVASGRQERPASLITVAVPPAKAFNIIDAIAARGLQPYVTLAANQTVDATFATAIPSPPSLPPDLALTATALAGIIASTPVPPPPPTGGGMSR